MCMLKHKTWSNTDLTHWPMTRPDPVKIADPVTQWPGSISAVNCYWLTMKQPLSLLTAWRHRRMPHKRCRTRRRQWGWVNGRGHGTEMSIECVSRLLSLLIVDRRVSRDYNHSHTNTHTITLNIWLPSTTFTGIYVSVIRSNITFLNFFSCFSCGM